MKSCDFETVFADYVHTKATGCWQTSAAKTFNFGPHGNFGIIFEKGLQSSKHLLQKNEDGFQKKRICLLDFCSFLFVTTVKWSNFDRRDSKMGFSCKVQRRPPADIFLNESLPPKPPPPCRHYVHGRHGQGSSVKNRWRFSRFCKKNTKLWPSL